MHEHGPDCLEGPIRGSHAWWRGTAPREESVEKPAKITKKKSTKTEETGIRKELVERIRRAIQAGTYDTPERWEAALDNLQEHMDQD